MNAFQPTVPAALLAVERLSFRFPGRDLLHELSFEAEPGECIALLGANGAGKSTLLDLIARLRPLSADTIRIAGRAQSELSGRELAKAISHLPQAVHADLPFSAEQLVAMGRYPHTDRWFESPDDHRLIKQAMQRTSCWPLRSRAFSSLSGGERQRVLLAACLAQEAQVLLLDEPSTFLDVAAQLECFELLRAEARAGKLCIAVTHDLNLALSFCTRLLVLQAGRIAHDLRPDQAAHDLSWLRVFSPSLRLLQTANDVPWVSYR